MNYVLGLGPIVGVLLFSTEIVSAQNYPPQCTTQFKYSAKCCAASYGRIQQGLMNINARHAEIAECTAKERSKKKKQG